MLAKIPGTGKTGSVCWNRASALGAERLSRAQPCPLRPARGHEDMWHRISIRGVRPGKGGSCRACYRLASLPGFPRVAVRRNTTSCLNAGSRSGSNRLTCRLAILQILQNWQYAPATIQAGILREPPSALRNRRQPKTTDSILRGHAPAASGGRKARYVRLRGFPERPILRVLHGGLRRPISPTATLVVYYGFRFGFLHTQATYQAIKRHRGGALWCTAQSCSPPAVPAEKLPCSCPWVVPPGGYPAAPDRPMFHCDGTTSRHN